MRRKPSRSPKTKGRPLMKGTGFSPYVAAAQSIWALAPEGCIPERSLLAASIAVILSGAGRVFLRTAQSKDLRFSGTGDDFPLRASRLPTLRKRHEGWGTGLCNRARLQSCRKSQSKNLWALAPVRRRLFIVVLCLTAFLIRGHAQTPATPLESATILDRVEAVVNNDTILLSDLDLEIRLSMLDAAPGTPALTRRQALDQLISRTLIEQQIHQEDAQAGAPSAADENARTAELRQALPPCAGGKCATDREWAALLAAHGLAPARADAYLRSRDQILRFIEQRFRQGIRISSAEVEAYYRATFVPQFPVGRQAPPLESVTPRIESILLEQQVNVLFDEWLNSLRKQGDIEVLDPALATAETAGGGTEARE